MSTSSGSGATVSFAGVIQPVFAQFRDEMLWRMDITSYDVVVANAWRIYSVLIGQDPFAAQMPPASFGSLPPGFVTAFQTWINQGFPP